MQDIRVLHIISGNDGGGAKTHLLNLCRNSGNLFKNTIGCINSGVLFDQALESGLDVVLFTQKSRTDLKILQQISKFIMKNHVDIVNFHGANPNFLHTFLKKRMKAKGVTTIHSDYRYDFMNSRLKYMLFTPVNAAALKNFDNFICVSGRIKSLMERRGFKGSKYVVNNGVDIDVSINESREEIRHRYDIPMDAFVYTMVARMHPVKNHESLIEALKLLVREASEVRILLVGAGDHEGSVRDKVRQMGMDRYVIFAGEQPNPQDYMNAGDINILTSFNETFPLVILEGAVVNRTAICSDVGDIKDIIDENTGFIINPHSVRDIYMKMKQAYLNRDNLVSMERNLHNVVIEKYALSMFCKRYSDAYSDILAGD